MGVVEPEVEPNAFSTREQLLLRIFGAVARVTYALTGGRRRKVDWRFWNSALWKVFDVTQGAVSKRLRPCPFAPPGAARYPTFDPRTHDEIIRCDHPGHCWKDKQYYRCE